MKWLLGLVLVLTGCLMTPVMTFGSGKTAKEAQHDTLNAHVVPTPLSTEGQWRGPIKDALIRVYADDDFRAQNRNWQKAFDERLQYVNAVLGAQFGVRLVADYREWAHHAPGATLIDQLVELEQLDRGDGVISVVGITSSQSLVSATFDALGYANLSGRHMMLRGYADLEERQAFSRAFPDLPAEERTNALEARRLHKTAAVLLHELAHNLGVDHELDEDTLMNATYSIHATEFSNRAHATMQHALDQRVGRAAPDPAPVAAAAPAAPAPVPVPTATPASRTSTQHATMQVVMLADGSVMIDGKTLDKGQQNKAFSTQAAMDAETDVVIAKDKSIPTPKVVELIDRAKAQGLKNITFK